MSNFTEYNEYDGLGLAELVRDGEVTAGEVVEAAIARIEALNPQLNAVIHTMYDRARAAVERGLPEGPFTGVPFLIKDLFVAYAGEPLRAGSRFFDGFVPDHDSELVRRYKAAGLVTLGKTNLPELGLLGVTEPELLGPTHNPWDLTRSPGGSSGGSAAAVAAGMAPLAHGSDAAGSLRQPASWCGLFSLKPSRGRTPAADIAPLLVIDHVLTRSVRDSAAMLDATAGPEVGAAYVAPPPARPFLDEVGQGKLGLAEPGKLRIAYTAQPLFGDYVHADCVAGLKATVSLLEELGHEVVEATPDVDGQAMVGAALSMLAAEVKAEVEEAEALLGREATPDNFEAATWAALVAGGEISAPDFVRATRQLRRGGRQFSRFCGAYDAFLTPTAGIPPAGTGSLAGDMESLYKVIPFLPLLANASGQPAMSVPLHWNDAGLPIGMQFVGRYGDEATLFRLAGQLERAQPWFHRRPAVFGLPA
ncbi:MAG: 6-aminohexanoate-cyclic-dimer hydrolase [Anaerolineales bacterium]|nr:6-aminohexanoate-cyclic-dimer hydrolase [Anaerolineales bacterium]